MKIKLSRVGEVVANIILCSCIFAFGILQYDLVMTGRDTRDRLDLYNSINLQNREEMLKHIRKIKEEQIESMKAQKSISERFIQAERELAIINSALNEFTTTDLPNYETIKEANILILNRTLGALGSGTRIKIKNKHYVLTCAHLIENDTDELEGVWDDNSRYPLKLISYDRDTDLALFFVGKASPGAYLEISDVEPSLGSSLVVIGNPSGITDVVTTGNLSRKLDKHYMITNIIYFGNSGGAVLYRGKIVGVISMLWSRSVRGQGSVKYGLASTLTNINTFLAGCNL